MAVTAPTVGAGKGVDEMITAYGADMSHNGASVDVSRRAGMRVVDVPLATLEVAGAHGIVHMTRDQLLAHALACLTVCDDMASVNIPSV